jgi:hypothetical protein
MGASFRNSAARTGNRTARFETGVIAGANTQNMTVDWTAQHSGKQMAGVQVMSPYLHYNNGEGFNCCPEVGAICVLCWPSDEESPFVMGFITAPEVTGAVSGDVKQEAQDPDVESPDDMPPAQTTNSGGTTTPKTTDASYRAGRPVMNPGDIWIQGRDENFLILKRGGVLQIGSTNICQRAYVPINNYIRDFCENYELNTAAGSLSWLVHPVEKDPGGNAPTEFTLLTREFAQDKSASIKVSVGSLDSEPQPPDAKAKTYIEVVVAPNNIDPASGKVSGDPAYVLRISKDGYSYSMQAGSRTVEVKQDDSLTVGRNQTIQVTKDRSLTVGGKVTETITGKHSITGADSSTETWAKIKTIDAPLTKIGGPDASEPATLGLQLLQWLATHTHPSNGIPTQAGMLQAILAKQVMVK